MVMGMLEPGKDDTATPSPEGEIIRLLSLLPARFEQADSRGAEYTGDGTAFALLLLAIGFFFVNVAFFGRIPSRGRATCSRVI
jgi:hypothetical protein